MNIAYEFAKVKDSFIKVKKDMHSMTDKINENYDDFMTSHKKLSVQIETLSSTIREHIENFRRKDREEGFDNREILQMQSEIKELKSEITQSMKLNFELSSVLDKIKKNESDISGVKEKLRASELEIYLLKERILEKNLEVKQMKEVSSHMLKVIEELSAVEIDLLNKRGA